MKWFRLSVLLLLIPLSLQAQLTPQLQIEAVKKEEAPAKQYELLQNIVEQKNPMFNGSFLELAENNYPYPVKRLALQGLEQNSPGENLVIADRIQALLEKEKEELLIEGELDLLGKIGSAKHEPTVVLFLPHQNINIRLAAVRALNVIGQESCVSPVKTLLTQEKGDSVYSKDIRKYAMLILSKYKSAVPVPELENAFITSVNNKSNSDESIYAMNAIKNSDEKRAQELVLQNTNKIADPNVKSELLQTANIPAPVAVQPPPVEPPPQVMTPPVVVEPPPVVVPPVQKTAPSVQEIPLLTGRAVHLDAELDAIDLAFTTPEEGMSRVSRLNDLVSFIESGIADGSLKKDTYSNLGDCFYRLGKVYDKLSDKKKAQESYKKSDDAYQKMMQEWGKK